MTSYWNIKGQNNNNNTAAYEKVSAFLGILYKLLQIISHMITFPHKEL